MPDPYVQYFLNSRTNVVEYDTLEISHSDFSRTYRLIRNNTAGADLTDEGGVTRFYEYAPFKLTGSEQRENMDFGLTIELGDLGEIIPTELDRISAQSGFGEKPVLIYRTWRSDDTARPLYGPIALEIKTFASNREGCVFEAKAPSFNVNGTGQLYKIDRFPMLRGFM